MKNKKAFTLIELIAVLVILAILALIVTPLVLNIIKKARVSADKRSIDAYGRSIELAIADYLLDKGTFPTSIEQLQVEYTGDKVECETTKLNSDSSAYLASCSVAGREVTGYTYGKEETNYRAYSVGDIIQYNGIQYYVIKDSSTSESAVTLLKAEPLTVEEITIYSAGTGAQTDNNGGMQYGTTSDYSTSYIKTTVDAWAEANVPNGLEEARLITLDELIDNLGYEYGNIDPSNQGYVNTETTLEWVSKHWYWTMSPYNDSTSRVWYVDDHGSLDNGTIDYRGYVVRPVITLSKSALN